MLPSTLVDLLEARVQHTPDRDAYRFLTEGNARGAVVTWSYRQLADRVRAVAVELQARGLTGRNVLLLYPPGLEFIAAFLGCLYAGAIAIPANPPDPARPGRTLPRLQGIASDCGAAAVLTDHTIAPMARALGSFAPALAAIPWIAIDDLPPGQPGNWRRPSDLGPERLAFLQYTSGSTSAPKGVMITHGNILHNQQVIHAAFKHDEHSALLGWLPLFHDMGLIGHVLQPLFLGTTGHLMAPEHFLRKPVEWLRAIHRFRPTTSGAPDFAFALCTRKVTDAELAELDLSSWAVAYSGAEPVRASTLRGFAERFAPAGFRAEFLVPCYGLAESTLMTTCSPRGPAAVIRPVDAAALAAGRLSGVPPAAPPAVPPAAPSAAPPAAPSAAPSAAPPATASSVLPATHSASRGRVVELVGVGGPFLGTEVCIVDPGSRTPRSDGEVGEIWARGPSIARGYWGKPEATNATFGAYTAAGIGPWLRTGDLGAWQDGALFVTGRLKDLVIVRGRNIFPEDLEEVIEKCHPALRAGGVAVFSVEAEGEERLVIACELEGDGAPQAVSDAIRGAVATAAEVPVYGVSLLARRALPRTSSGKRQRQAARQGFLEGTLEEVARFVMPAAELEVSGESAIPSTLPEMERWLAQQVGALLGLPVERVPRDEPFAHLGLDSLRAVNLVSRLEPLLGRPLHASVIYNVPTVARLAAWLVEGGVMASGEGSAEVLYPKLEAAIERIDRRDPEQYRFDLELHIPWRRTGEAGIYVPVEMYATLGVDVGPVEAEPEAWEMLQAASALAVCSAFEVVEVTIGLFLDTRRSALGATRVIEQFREEEDKHVRLFRRYADALRARHPELRMELHWDRSWGVGFWELFRSPELFPSERVFHYLFWFFFVAFEEHSIFFADLLNRADGVQPAWLAAHQAHRREELQHVANDHAYVGALVLPEEERDAWSEVCVAWLCQHFQTFFAFGSARRLVARRFPHLAPHLRSPGFVRSPFLGELLSAPSFRRTRLSCPYLRELAQLAPSAWPDDAALARRLPAEWMEGRVITVSDPVEG